MIIKKKKRVKKMSNEKQDEKISKEGLEKMNKIKDTLEKFKEKIIKKLEKYVAGVSLLPPQKDEKGNINQDKINVLVLIDDSDSQKQNKNELKEKLEKTINKIALDIDKSISPEVMIYTELWQACYDGRSEILQLIATSAPIHDNGMLSAVKIAEVHKTMVLKKFEKYIVSYVLAGSLVQGRATKESDIDVFVVIDDTDVKKMTRAELKDKLRAIIIGMGVEAGEMTGIRNKINIQVYILTDFWESIKEANPVIFTFLRDGVPFYDRGIFMPWKQLLKMGKIKPSGEAIEMYMGTGEQMLQRVELKLKEIGMEDIFYALLTPSQAAIMMQGMPPPTPKETPEVMKDLFVKKLKLLEPEYVTIIADTIKLRKDLEHGTKTKISGKELDVYLTKADKYLKRIKKLFSQIEKTKEDENVINMYDTVMTLSRDVLKLEDVNKIKDEEITNLFKEHIISKGLLPEKFLRILKDIIKAKKAYDSGKITKTESQEALKKTNEFTRTIIEYLQRKKLNEFDKTRIKIKYEDKQGEVIVLEKKIFIIKDLAKDEKEIFVAEYDESKIGLAKQSSMNEMDKEINEIKSKKAVTINKNLFKALTDIFGEKLEILFD
jgi:predicted nucleotidyltransferase